MKITKKQLFKLIQEEFALVRAVDTPQNNPISAPNSPYYDYSDEEGVTTKQQVEQLMSHSSELLSVLGDNEQLDSWIKEKITKALESISTVKNHLEHEVSSNESESCACGGCDEEVSPDITYQY